MGFLPVGIRCQVLVEVFTICDTGQWSQTVRPRRGDADGRGRQNIPWQLGIDKT